MSDQVTMVDVATLQSWIREGSVVVVDVREPHEYDAGHIKDAILLPLSSWDSEALPAVAPSSSSSVSRDVPARSRAAAK